MKIKKVHVIVNPASGKKNADALSIISAAMQEAGITITTSLTEKAGDALSQAKTAVKSGVDALAVCGGDGTLKEAAGALIGTGTPMILLPAGSANVLANELGIPQDLKEACTQVAKNEFGTKAIDVAKTEHGYFIVRSSLGFQADMVKDTRRETKNKFGVLAYFLGAFHTVKNMKLAEYRIKIDGTEHRSRGVTCIVTNAGNLGFSKISLDKDVDISDGLLDVLVVKKADLNLVKHLLTTLVKGERPDDWSLVSHWQGKVIEVTSEPQQQVEMDGEVLQKSTIQAEVLPGALQILIPPLKSPA